MFKIYIDPNLLEILVVSTDNPHPKYNTVSSLIKHGFLTEDATEYNSKPISLRLVKSVLLAHPNHGWNLQLANITKPL